MIAEAYWAFAFDWPELYQETNGMDGVPFGTTVGGMDHQPGSGTTCSSACAPTETDVEWRSQSAAACLAAS